MIDCLANLCLLNQYSIHNRHAEHIAMLSMANVVYD